MPNKKDCLGLKFGRLLVLQEVPVDKGKRRKVMCKCECGDSIVADPRDLFSGHTKSCGCYHKDAVSLSTAKRSTTHGMSKGKEYNTWRHMKDRCYNKKNAKYKDYGGAGISVDSRWLYSFESFLSDMGLAPTISHSIERIDVFGNYCPENCKWALPIEQARNKKKHRFVEYKGVVMPLSQACDISGTNYRSALYRINTGKHFMPTPQPPVKK